MKPLISRGQFDRFAKVLTDEQRHELADSVQLYPDHYDPAGGVRIDQERIKIRYLELLAERVFHDSLVPSQPALPGAPRRGAEPAFTATDEGHAELLRRWQEVRKQFGARQDGKAEAMRRLADECERVTGVRPDTISVQASGTLSVAPIGADVHDPDSWAVVGHELELLRDPVRGWPKTPEAAAAAYAKWAHTDAGGEWMASLETLRCQSNYVTVDEVVGRFDEERTSDALRRQYLGEWKKEDRPDIEPYVQAIKDSVNELADRADVPRDLLW